MGRYRKKPVEIEAVQLRWDTWGEMCDHAGVGKLADGKPQGCYVNEAGEGVDEFPGDPPDGLVRIGLWIPTLEGLMLGVQDDYIIRGVKSELYPCKPDIFEATYEAVDGGAESDDVDVLIERATVIVLGVFGTLYPRQRAYVRAMLSTDGSVLAGGGKGWGKTTVRRVAANAIYLRDRRDQVE